MITLRQAFIFLCILLIYADADATQVKRWRVGDGDHPWNLTPVTGRLSWGRGWASEILVDDDGDGLIDEDPVELIDNDNDGLVNEDPPEPQIDNDNDGQLNEDPVDNRDNDGDGLIDEDPVESFDDDRDGIADEDGPDLQIDNDGDGRLNEDGLWTDGDDDFDTLINEDPPNGVDDDGDGLIDEDGPQQRDDPAANVTTWLRPIRLDSGRNLAYMLYQRYQLGEFGGLIEAGKEPTNLFMLVPDEASVRTEAARPIRPNINMIDGDLSTMDGSPERGWRWYNDTLYIGHNGGPQVNTMGYFVIDRIIFRPRPTLPQAAINSYILFYGDQTTIDLKAQAIATPKILAPEVFNVFEPVKDIRLDKPTRMGAMEVFSLDQNSVWVEVAEVGLFGQGYPSDASYTSEIIDIGTPVPRIRRYSRQPELFSGAQQHLIERQFPQVPGAQVNWGRVRWRGRRDGADGDIRLQFRTGNSPDTHVYARKLGLNEASTLDEDGVPLNFTGWLGLNTSLPQQELQYNELGANLGHDGPAGWSFWSAPFTLEQGLIGEDLPPERWGQVGVPLPLPGGTRYIQFRILFDNTQHSGVALDFIEFDYASLLVSGGVVAEIFPARAALGQEQTFRYFIRPLFDPAEATGFNRIEIDVPAGTQLDSLKFDGSLWREIDVPAGPGAAADPLAQVVPARFQGDGPVPLGEFAQATVTNPATGRARILLKVPVLGAKDFKARQTIELVFRARLLRGLEDFAGAVWDDRDGPAVIRQPFVDGDAAPQIHSDATQVVVNRIAAQGPAASVAPNPFTPNGDGINDAAVIQFDVLLALEDIAYEVEIFDLSGHPVWRLGPVAQAAGPAQVQWDGRDASGRSVPPGMYIYTLRIDADQGVRTASGTIAVVY